MIKNEQKYTKRIKKEEKNRNKKVIKNKKEF